MHNRINTAKNIYVFNAVNSHSLIIIPHIYIILFFTLFFFSPLSAQVKDSVFIPADTLLNTPPDSLQIADTSANKKYDVDTTIFASSNDSIIFLLDKKEMRVYGNGELDYKQTKLKSANIFVDFETSDIVAFGASSDSSGKEVGTPVLNDGGEEYEGKRMKYNFKTGRGLISSAGTKADGAYYTGSKINKVDPETYFIKDGVFTTCDDSIPDYYFYAPEMKVIHKQQIVAKWIWLFFGGVPFPIPLPFGVFPIESGRRSGILPPAFGQDGTYGYYFSRFGYFWAISDYMDLNLTADYFTRGSYNLNSNFRYAKRYNYSGNVDASYSYKKGGEPGSPDYSKDVLWRLGVNHHQDIDPTMRLDANLEFTSGSQFYQQNVSNMSQNLRQDIVSSATLSKSWDESGNSLSIGYTRNQNLKSGDIHEYLPTLNFSMSQKYPFRGENSSTTNLKWYELIGYNYNTQFRNDRDKVNNNLKIRGGIQHSLTINASPKLGYVSITPNIQYNEKWYNKKVSKEAGISPFTGKDTIFTNDVHQINMLRTFSLGASAQTRFYGIFNPNMLGISSIRHTVTPSVSYNYTPDFSKPFWGYYETYVDTSGNIARFDPYEKEIYQGVSAHESQAITFSVGNIFEMKTTVDPTDTTSKENKIQLLNLQSSIGYNFTAPEFKISDLSIDASTQVGEWFSFRSGLGFTPYSYDAEGKKINILLADLGKGILRLTDFNFSISTSLSGERLKSNDENQQPDSTEDEHQLEQSNRSIYQGLYQDKEADFTIPWNLSLNYNFSQDQTNPYQKHVYSSITGTIDFNLTPNWKFSFGGSYDFKNHEFAAPQIKISRDLHCWIMNFTWNPTGTYRGYRLEIRVKAPQLQDLKITKRDEFYNGK